MPHGAAPGGPGRTVDMGRRTSGAVAAVVCALALGCTPQGGGAPPLPCTRTDMSPTSTPITSTGITPASLPPDVDLDFRSRPVAEQVSANGTIHVWIVGELTGVALFTEAISRMHLYAQDTTTGEPPVLVYQVQKRKGLFGPRLITDTDGWPVTANVDAISFDGTQADISVTYGTLHSLYADLAWVGEPYESSVHHIACG